MGNLMLLKPKAGFIRPTAMGITGPPVIIMTIRKLRPGFMKEYLTAFQHVADMCYREIPGVLGYTVAKSEVDQDMVHELHVFASFEEGFLKYLEKFNLEIDLDEKSHQENL